MTIERNYNIAAETLFSLPEDIQIALGDGELVKHALEIAQKYSFDRTTTDILIEEIAFVLLGMSNPNELDKVLAEQLSLDTARGVLVASDVRKIILNQYKEQLDAMYSGATPSAPTTPPQNPPSLSGPKVPVPQAPAQPTSVFEEKLKRVFTVPREESRVASTPTVPVAPKAPTPPAAPRPGSDPYREPLT